MTVQIKLLKGFKNYVNGEFNTLSLLIKSGAELQEHLSNAREKLLVSLTSIIDDYDSNYDIYFYHKLQVSNGRKTDYLSTKACKTKSNSIKKDLNDSIKNLLKINHSKFISHFVNITILLNDDKVNLSKDEFSNLNWKIRLALSKINSGEHAFVDDNEKVDVVKPIKKKNNKKSYNVKPIKKNNSSDSLFIDDDVKPIKKNNSSDSLFIDDDVKPIKKNNSSDSLFIDDDVKPIKKNNSSDSLFIDDDVKPFKKNNSSDSLFIDEVKPIKKNKKVDVVKRIKKNNKCNKPIFIDNKNNYLAQIDYSEWCDHGKWFN